MSIPSASELRVLSQKGRVEQDNQFDAMRLRLNEECNRKMREAASRGNTSCHCDVHITEDYVANLRGVQRLNVKFVDTCDDGEGGRMSSVDALEPSHHQVSW